MKTYTMPLGLLVLVVLLAAGSTSTAMADTAPTTQVVTPDTLHLDYLSWFFYDDTDDIPYTTEAPGSYEFAYGPATPPAGAGSVRFDTTGSQRWNMATVQFHGTMLPLFTELKYSTYQPSSNPGSTTKAIYLHFDVDFDLSDADTSYQGRLVYVPRENGTVLQDTWQEWDAIDGGAALWNWSRYSSNGSKWPDGVTDYYRTWDDLVASFPTAGVGDDLGKDRFLLRAGEPYADGFTGYLDRASIGIDGLTTTYDFEPESAQAIKADVLAHIQAAIVTANDHDAVKLGQAAAKLAASLDPALWNDGLHPASKRVFDFEKQAAQKLAELQRDKRSDFDDALLQSWIDRLVGADRWMAEVAIAEATDAKQVARATKELDKGDAAAAAGNGNTAIGYYGVAWLQATK